MLVNVQNAQETHGVMEGQSASHALRIVINAITRTGCARNAKQEWNQPMMENARCVMEHSMGMMG